MSVRKSTYEGELCEIKTNNLALSVNPENVGFFSRLNPYCASEMSLEGIYVACIGWGRGQWKLRAGVQRGDEEGQDC